MRDHPARVKLNPPRLALYSKLRAAIISILSDTAPKRCLGLPPVQGMLQSPFLLEYRRICLGLPPVQGMLQYHKHDRIRQNSLGLPPVQGMLQLIYDGPIDCYRLGLPPVQGMLQCSSWARIKR